MVPPQQEQEQEQKLSLHDVKHLVVSAMVLPEQEPAPGLYGTALDVQHQVMAHVPGNRDRLL